MALVAEIVKDAYREANLISINQSPSINESTEGLRLLNRIVRAVFGAEAGENLRSISINRNTYSGRKDQYVPSNSRLIMDSSSFFEVLNLAPNPDDGARFSVVDINGTFADSPLTISGNGRNIDGQPSVTLSSVEPSKEWFYRADLGSWITVSSLELTNVFPFPIEFEDYFILTLATRINPRNGIMMDEQTIANLRKTKSSLRSRYRQVKTANSEDGILRLTNVTWNRIPDYRYDVYFNNT